MGRATIGIDCRLGGVRHAGIGRYVAEYVQRVVTTEEFNFSLIFSDSEQLNELLHNIEVKHQSRLQFTIAPYRHYSLSEQLRLPSVFNRLNLNLLHVPHFNVPLGYRRPFVVTIHDLLWHSTRGTTVTTLPAWQYWLKYGAYHLIVGDTIGRAERIFTPTQFVADTIKEHYPTAAHKTVVTYEGVGSQFVIDRTVKRDRAHLLYVGSLYPHKNVVIILDALLHLPDHRLTVVGARDAFTQEFIQEISRRELDDRVTLKNSVSDDALVRLYQSVGAVIQPSTSEGFGLTGVEALACGAPLLASDIAVFHEVYVEAANYFDPVSATGLAELVRNLPTINPISDHARATTLNRYSWETMTQTMLAQMRSIIASRQST